METKLCFLHHHHHPHRSTVSSPNWVPWKSIQKPECSRRRTIRAVLTRTQDHTSNIRLTDDSIIASSSATSNTVHNDGWFDLIAINYLSQNLQAAAGIKSKKSGYEGLLEATSLISNKFNTKTQQELVIQTLERAIPSPILSLIRALIPSSKFKRELYALFTTFFFAWLVGPSQVKESKIDGRMEKNVVHIKKCRFLESSGCVGMCVNLCKIPSQKFIKDSFGMPVNMVPNFDDMSCEMIFGQDPPTAADDPALKQPCYKILCNAKKKHTSDCTD